METQPVVSFPALSKRAARRLIQRAFVLIGRERSIRQHLREAELTTLWVLEDWGLEWTVIFDHGRGEYHRGRVGRPRLKYAWRTTESFFRQVENGAPVEGSFECTGDPAIRKLCEPVFMAFTRMLRAVVANPVDDDGERLA